MLALSSFAMGMSLVTPPERIIMKFGGSSVRDAERITEVCKLVQLQIDDGMKPYLVCSAMGGVTNKLLEAADQAIMEREADVMGARAASAGVRQNRPEGDG